MRESGETALTCFEAGEDADLLQGYHIYGTVHVGCIGRTGGNMVICHPYRATATLDPDLPTTVYWGTSFGAVTREVMGGMFSSQCEGDELWILSFLMTIGVLMIMPVTMLTGVGYPVAVHIAPHERDINRVCFVHDDGPPDYCRFILPLLPDEPPPPTVPTASSP